MIKQKESEAFHIACKKLKPAPIEADPSIQLKPMVRAEKKVKQSKIEKPNEEVTDAV
jgi:hypothetical protein